MGRITGNDTDFFECTLQTKDLSDGTTNRRAFLGSMFFMETWFRLDPYDIPLDGQTAVLFCLEIQ